MSLTTPPMPLDPSMAPAQQQAAMFEAAAKAQLSTNLGYYLGPFIIGLVFDMVLLGVMFGQLSFWLSYSSKERLSAKILLAFAVTVTTATSCFGIAFIFKLFVYSFGVYSPILDFGFASWFAIFDVLTTVTVQAFYTQRAYRINGNAIWVPIIISPFILASAVGAIALKVAAAHLTGNITMSFHSLDPDATATWFYIWLGTTLAGDLLITSLIIWGLYQSRTGWSETDRLIYRVVRRKSATEHTSASMTSSSTVSVLMGEVCRAIAFLVNYAIKPGISVVVYELFHPKVYVVCLLAVLNSRFGLQREFARSGLDSSGRSNNYNLKDSGPHQETVQLDDLPIEPAPGTNEYGKTKNNGEDVDFDVVSNLSRRGLTSNARNNNAA